MNNTIIQVQNLVIMFGDFKAVNDISFEVSRGEIFGFLGANGAGKTTTIRTLCGILNPTSGKVLVNGVDVTASTAVLKPHIGYMSQKFTLYPDLTVWENMDIAGSLYELSRPQIRKRTEELFSFIGLTTIPSGTVRQLSGGTKQMIALAASILHNPELIFLDEPTAGTSPKTRQAFWNLIRQLSAQGKTIFVTTHYMDEAEYCHRIVLMERGRILAMDTPHNLKQTYFPQKPVELTFTSGQQQIILKELRRLALGNVGVFGNKLRVNITDNNAFEAFAQKHQADFTVCSVEPTLDDVFLKAITGAK